MIQMHLGCAIETISNLVFWSCLVNKLEPWHIVHIMEPSDRHLLYRLQFPCLTSIAQLIRLCLPS